MPADSGGWQQLFSPRSGRAKIAQRLSLGTKSCFSKQVREADDRSLRTVSSQTNISVARFTGLRNQPCRFPSSKLLGYFRSSASRTCRTALALNKLSISSFSAVGSNGVETYSLHPAEIAIARYSSAP